MLQCSADPVASARLVLVPLPSWFHMQTSQEPVCFSTARAGPRAITSLYTSVHGGAFLCNNNSGGLRASRTRLLIGETLMWTVFCLYCHTFNRFFSFKKDLIDCNEVNRGNKRSVGQLSGLTKSFPITAGCPTATQLFKRYNTTFDTDTFTKALFLSCDGVYRKINN